MRITCSFSQVAAHKRCFKYVYKYCFKAPGNDRHQQRQQSQSQPKPQLQKQIQTMPLRETQYNPYLPAEPNFITRFNTNQRQF